MVHIYTGDGKGKTTAALGLCFRAAGHGRKILFFEFLKDGSSGEVSAAESVPGFEICCVQTTVCGFYWNMTEQEREKLKAETQAGFSAAISCALKRQCDVLVLDEVAGCMTNGLLLPSDVLAFLETYGKKMEIVLTGRDFPDTVLSAADYVSHIHAVKHPFEMGMPPREGIEF